MLHQLAPRDITSFGAQQTSEFKIKASGKAFRILIDGLYSDKVTAVVRELISNGIDSHIKAGKVDAPLLIRVPTSMNPTFSVRDFGVGMTHETVMTNYSTLFDSTKEDDDAQIGKLGLGSKSPFAYTDAFNLQCWDGTSVRRYMVYINQQHVPVIDYVGSEESRESRGVEVALAVEPSAFHDFVRAAQRIASDLTVIPEFIGATAPETPAVSAEGEGWKLYASSTYGLQLAARQGQITYTIDSSKFSDRMKLIEIAATVRRGRLVLDFPPNTLGFTASREQLEYTPETVARISAALDLFISSQLERYRKMLRDEPSAWVLTRYIAENGLWDVFKYLTGTLDEKHYGKRLSSWFNMPKGMTAHAQAYSLYSRRSVVQYPTFRKSQTTPHNFDQSVVLFFYDTRKLEKNVVERIYEHMTLLRRQGSGKERAVLIRYSTDMQLKRILVSLGRPDVGIAVATLPGVQRINAEGVKREYTNGGILRSSGLDRCKVDLKAGGYYIVARKDEVHINGYASGYSFRSMFSTWEVACKFGGIDAPLHVFTPAQSLKLRERPEWVPFETVAKTLHGRFEERVASAVALQRRSEDYHIPDLVKTLADHVEKLIITGAEVDAKFGTALSAIVRAREEQRSLEKAFSDYLPLERVFRVINQQVLPDKNMRVPKTTPLGVQVINELPLLGYLRSNTPIDVLLNEYILR
jgi:hypothetical protein